MINYIGSIFNAFFKKIFLKGPKKILIVSLSGCLFFSSSYASAAPTIWFFINNAGYGGQVSLGATMKFAWNSDNTTSCRAYAINTSTGANGWINGLPVDALYPTYYPVNTNAFGVGNIQVSLYCTDATTEVGPATTIFTVVP